MEDLQEALRDQDPDAFATIVENKFTDTSLMLINEASLTNMGIIAEGTKLIILGVVDTLKSKKAGAQSDQHPSTSKRLHDTPPSLPKKQACIRFSVADINVYELLKADNDFRNILRDQLDEGIVPEANCLKQMVRIVCAPFKTYLHSFKPAKYATLEEKETIAIKILETFPFLESTKACETAPAYSAFFWKNGGATTYQEHTGYVHTHLRNSTRSLPKEQKKFTRSPKTPKTPCVPDEVIEKAANCARFADTSANFAAISKVMNEVHPLLMMLRSEKKDVKTIQDSYERINGEDFNREADLRKIFSKGLLYSKNSFAAVKDDHIRGALRIMKALTRRGTKSIPDAENMEPNSNSTTVDHELAAPIIIWLKDDQNLKNYSAQHPHILCQNENYSIFLAAGIIFSCGTNSVQCLDTFFKTFCVFNLQVPTRLLKIADFLDVLAFKVKDYTTRVGVRQLVAEFQEVESAENSVLDVNV